MELLSDAHVLKIVVNVCLFYSRLVNIVNLPKGFNDVGSNEYRNVHVHGHCFGFSLATINEYLGRGKIIIADRIPPLKIIAQEITRNIHDN